MVAPAELRVVETGTRSLRLPSVLLMVLLVLDRCEHAEPEHLHVEHLDGGSPPMFFACPETASIKNESNDGSQSPRQRKDGVFITHLGKNSLKLRCSSTIRPARPDQQQSGPNEKE
jgi:hypothetical protein